VDLSGRQGKEKERASSVSSNHSTDAANQLLAELRAAEETNVTSHRPESMSPVEQPQYYSCDEEDLTFAGSHHDFACTLYVTSARNPLRLVSSGHNWWIVNQSDEVTCSPGYDLDQDPGSFVSMDVASHYSDQAWRDGPTSEGDNNEP
jgi:hypothetical protein